ncbi:hypothetical protein JZ751_023583 [Albula glossodonta]|uniref:AF4/FMR2 C-terminal homology domain-containing protein n=1 Tax=Albula glossodonta TaxID=121402 RepID=A0A8T2NI89_9TELE|nr:hypothetical protein JZ751_023583 [Albula glossodonta]
MKRSPTDVPVYYGLISAVNMPTIFGVKNKLARICSMVHCTSQEVKPHYSYHKDSTWFIQQRMTFPRTAPHKSCADQQGTQGSRDRRSSSSASSSSSGSSSSSSDSDSSSQCSRSPSPEMHSRPEPSATTWTPNCSTEEMDQPSSTQWQLDRWLNKVKKRQESGDEERRVEAEPLSNRDSTGTQSLDYSPGQREDHSPFYSPAPSPSFTYSPGFHTRHSSSPNPKSNRSPRHQPQSKPRPSPSPSPERQSQPKCSPSPRTHCLYKSKSSPRPQSKHKSRPSPSPSPSPTPRDSRQSEVGGQKKSAVSQKKEGREFSEDLRHRWIQAFKGEDDGKERKEKRRKEKEERKAEKEKERVKPQEAESPAVQPKQRPHTNTQRPRQEALSIDYEKWRRKKKRRKTEDSETSVMEPRSSPSPSPSPKPVLPPTDSSSDSDSERRPPTTITKGLADSTSSRRRSSVGQENRPGKPEVATKPNAGRPSWQTKETPAEDQRKQKPHKLYTLVPFGRKGKSSHADSLHPQYARARSLRSLRVKIDLALLPKKPDTASPPPLVRSSSSSSSTSSLRAAQHNGATRRMSSPESDHKRRRKSTDSDLHRGGKKNHHPSEPPTDKAASTIRKPLETHSDAKLNRHKEDRPGSKRKPISSLSPPLDTTEQPKNGGTPQPPNRTKTEITPEQNTKIEVKRTHQQDLSQSICKYKDSALTQVTCPSQAPSMNEVAHQVERYMLEAKRLKHRADTMVDRFGKVLNYVDAALYAMRLKRPQGSGSSKEEKQLAVLCALLDYFKNTASSFLTPPPWNGQNAGLPFSTPPSPPHLSSLSAFISIPQHIHQMAAEHLEITNCVLYSYEYWEVADNLAKESKEFFNYLNTLMGPLTLQSSMAHIVRYTRQGLQWIRSSVQMA